MDTEKPWASKTLWGAFFLLVAMGLNMGFGAEITAGEQVEMADTVVEAIEAVTAVVGWLLVVWGRLTATKKVSLR